MRCRARVRCDGAPPLPLVPPLARAATARSSKRQAHAGPASGGYRPRASLQSTRSNERTNQTPEQRATPGAEHGERRLRCRARVPTSGATRRGESTHTRNPGTQRPGRRHSAVECRLHNDRELSCKDEGRLGGSLRPESRPPALSASNDMLCGARSKFDCRTRSDIQAWCRSGAQYPCLRLLA